MQAVLRLIEQKEAAILQVRRELEALRLAATILAEPGDTVPAVNTTAAAPVTKPSGLAVTPTPPPKSATPPRAGNGNGPAIAEVLRFTREPEARTKTIVDLPPAPVPVHIALFPQPQNGWIVCDACGHRNPDYLIDCEQCDIPIRLRPER